jgi:hypothetical protein
MVTDDILSPVHAHTSFSSFEDETATTRSCDNRLDGHGFEERSQKLIHKFGAEIFWNSITMGTGVENAGPYLCRIGCIDVDKAERSQDSLNSEISFIGT